MFGRKQIFLPKKMKEKCNAFLVLINVQFSDKTEYIFEKTKKRKRKMNL